MRNFAQAISAVDGRGQEKTHAHEAGAGNSHLALGFTFAAGVIFFLGLGLLIAAYVILRGIGKVFGYCAAARVLLGPGEAHPVLGLGLLSQGGMAMAITISYAISFELSADLVVTIVALAMIVNEVLVAHITNQLARRMGAT